MMRKALGIVAALAVLSVISVAVAQSRRPQPPAIEQATRALNEGHYDRIAGLLEKLDAQDPTVAALIARADIARGRYQPAEAALRPIAQRAPTSDAALELGLLLQTLGRSDANAVLDRVATVANTARDASDFARGARALRALGRFEEAKAAFIDAEQAAPRDPAIETAFGELFLDAFNRAEALKSFQAALRVDSKYVPALLGSARALSDEDPPQAQAIAKMALEINPSSVPLHLFLAEEATDAGKREDARKLLQSALEVNPSSLEAHSLMAGLAYIEDKTPEFESEIGKALAVNPNYGEGYRVAAELASHNYRYEDAATLARKAIALSPNNARILSDMGIHLLRTGDEGEARSVLERSFQLNGYNQVTYNLLQMMDTLDKFVTVRDGDLILRIDKDEAPVLQDPALALAHEALNNYIKRYNFTPKGPILIEIFPKHDHFAVRTAGLPGMVGALGACFGRVVTMDSPHARPGEFQWEATLWHELAHVITLQMSNNRVPRWLTEGISVWEEKVHRPEWSRGMDMSFAGMLNRKETLKLRDLNAAFTDGRTISLAYYEGGLLVEHIVGKYGEDGLHKLLYAYAKGLDFDDALKEALNVNIDQLQTDFDQTLDKMFGKLRVALQMEPGIDFRKMPADDVKKYAAQHEGSYAAQLTLGEVLQKEGNDEGALLAFEKAAVLAPMATGDDSPNAQIAELALKKKDNARAIKALQELETWDFDNPEVARKLARLMKESGVQDPAALRPIYQRIVQIDPFDPEANAALGRSAMQMNQPAEAIRAFKAVVALKPVDPAMAYTDLAESYFKSGNRAEARKQTLAALEIAPSYERAQDLLLKIAENKQ
jgi:tetratricopeptide (TPR) repeat protein